MENRVNQKTKFPSNKNVLYLMQRDHRIQDNHSTTLAYNLSYQNKSNLFIGTNIHKIKKNESQHAFILEGLEELSKLCQTMNLPFFFIEDIEIFIKENNIDSIVTEFSPLREYLEYQNEIEKICKKEKVSFYICDSHNIVPCVNLTKYVKSSSGVKKQLYNFYDKYFVEIKKLEKHKFNKESDKIIGKSGYYSFEDYKEKPMNKSRFKGGLTAGLKQLKYFIENSLHLYKKARNDPSLNILSNLSPWIHTGQLSAQYILREVSKKCSKDDENLECFFNEVFVWRETAEHFCYHEKNYDSIEGALPWAKETLKVHASDPRIKIYSLEQLEKARTDDDEWNAGQKEMVLEGKMHGYARMYWAKKLLYWTKKPETALEYAIYLNDKYSVDGNDPNGYLGVMWSICGTMDQGWGEREIIGKVRSMKGVKSKAYVQRWKDKKL